MSRTRRISRFALVGVLIAGLYVVLYLAFLHVGMPRGAANVAAFGLAIAAQYSGQAAFTFQKDLADPAQMLRFGVMVGCGLITSALITGLVAPALALDDWFAAAAVAVILPVQNFVLMTLWVFSHPST